MNVDDVSEIAGESILRLGERHVEPLRASPSEKGLHASSMNQRITGGRGIFAFDDHGPTLTGCELSAEPELVGDRGGSLLVCRISRVQGDSHSDNLLSPNLFGVPFFRRQSSKFYCDRLSSRRQNPLALWISEVCPLDRIRLPEGQRVTNGARGTGHLTPRS
jgi:hypothetical protein